MLRHTEVEGECGRGWQEKATQLVVVSHSSHPTHLNIIWHNKLIYSKTPPPLSQSWHTKCNLPFPHLRPRGVIHKGLTAWQAGRRKGWVVGMFMSIFCQWQCCMCEFSMLLVKYQCSVFSLCLSKWIGMTICKLNWRERRVSGWKSVLPWGLMHGQIRFSVLEQRRGVFFCLCYQFIVPNFI